MIAQATDTREMITRVEGLRELAATRMGDDMPMMRVFLNDTAHYIELLESERDWYAKQRTENQENA